MDQKLRDLAAMPRIRQRSEAKLHGAHDAIAFSRGEQDHPSVLDVAGDRSPPARSLVSAERCDETHRGSALDRIHEQIRQAVDQAVQRLHLLDRKLVSHTGHADETSGHG